MKKFIIALLSLAACSTAKVRVLPGEDGINRVVSKDIHSEGAEEASVDAANDYCKKHDKEAVFLKDKTEYKGSMDENTRNTVHKASQAAMMIGGGVGGATNHHMAGGVLGSAGGVGYMMTNDRDYQSEVFFKCK